MGQGRQANCKTRQKALTAFNRGDEIALTEAVVAKYAKTLDACESARDLKPLASGLFEALDRLNSLKAAKSKQEATPLARILKMDELRVASGE